MREIAEGDGVLLVDPTDPGAVADAMRRLLTDDAIACGADRRGGARHRTSWQEYAAALWSCLVAGGPGRWRAMTRRLRSGGVKESRGRSATDHPIVAGRLRRS